MTSIEPALGAQTKPSRLRSMAYILNGVCIVQGITLGVAVFYLLIPFSTIFRSFDVSVPVLTRLIFTVSETCDDYPLLTWGGLLLGAVLLVLLTKVLPEKLAIGLNIVLYLVSAIGLVLMLLSVAVPFSALITSIQ